MLAARATGAPLDHAVAVGCAAELIHTATLYHDDVVDDGRVRRGRPAARMVFGNGVVVLVGDFCLARALETVAMTGSLAMVQSLATTVTEMAEGEVAQLERAGNPDATVEDYFRVIDRKTASLIAWCARVGGSVDAALAAPLERYGRALGRAFQIADDVLDSAIDETTAGKSVGHDLQEGKLTLPVLLACEADPALGGASASSSASRAFPRRWRREILADVRARAAWTRRAARRARSPTRRRARWRRCRRRRTATRCARSRTCRRTGAPDVARSRDGDARRRDARQPRARAATARPRTGRIWRRSSASWNSRGSSGASRARSTRTWRSARSRSR